MSCVGVSCGMVNRFEQVYRHLSRRSRCDSVGSVEYMRVLQEWIVAGCPTPISPFVIRAANRPPGVFPFAAD